MDKQSRKQSIISSSLTKYRSSSFAKKSEAFKQKFKFSEKELLLIKKRFFFFQKIFDNLDVLI